MTERVNGTPTMAKKIQKRRPGKVTGAMLPYPMVVRMVVEKKID